MSKQSSFTSRSLARSAALLALGMIAGLAFSPRAGSGASARSDARATETVQCEPSVAPASIPKLAAPPQKQSAPEPLPPVTGSEEALAHGQAASRDLADRLRKRTAIAERLTPSRDPQEVMAQLLPYVQGMADTLIQVGPEYAEDFAAEVERSLCDGESSEALTLVMVRLAATSPDLGTARGYDCVFSRAETTPPIMNTAIEAWRASGLPRSEALDALARSSTEQRLRIEGAQQRMRLHESNLITEETERNNP